LTTQAANLRSHIKKLLPVLAVVVTFVIAAILLRLEGRMWICSCGTVRAWTGEICSADNSQHFLDPYSFTHILHGFLLFWLISWLAPRVNWKWQLSLAIAAEALWEVFENTEFIINRYRSETAALGYTGDTVINSIGDIICCLIGFAIAQWIGLRRSLIVFVALEFILFVWIRDGLLLNILMLIFPIEAIKAVQMCR
jgi:hypothetical protein